MALRGARPADELTRRRKAMNVYVEPDTHTLIRIIAENRKTTIGELVDRFVREAATTDGINLGRAS